MFQRKVVAQIKAQQCSVSSPETRSVWDNVEKYGRTGQAIDDGKLCCRKEAISWTSAVQLWFEHFFSSLSRKSCNSVPIGLVVFCLSAYNREAATWVFRNFAWEEDLAKTVEVETSGNSVRKGLPDIRTLCRICILVYMAPAWTYLTKFVGFLCCSFCSFVRH